MTDQPIIVTSQTAAVAAAATYLAASVGHFQALCGLSLATALLQRERNAAGQPELSHGTAAERATAAFEDALNASGKVSAKTVDNICRTMRKGASFAIARIQKEKTLYTMTQEELTEAFFGAELETLEGFKPNLRDIDAAISAANGSSRKAKSKPAASDASTEAAADAGEVKQAASTAERFAEAVKTLAALAGDVENHAMIADSQEVGDLVALILKIRREGVSQEQTEQREAA